MLQSNIGGTAGRPEKRHQLGESFDIVGVGWIPLNALFLACHKGAALQTSRDVLGYRRRNRNPLVGANPPRDRVDSTRKVKYTIEQIDIQRIGKRALQQIVFS